MQHWVVRSGLAWGVLGSACSLTADLDSLTSGGPGREQPDAASPQSPSGPATTEVGATSVEVSTESERTTADSASSAPTLDPGPAPSFCDDCSGAGESVTTLPSDSSTETSEADGTTSAAAAPPLSSDAAEASSTAIDVSSAGDEATAPSTLDGLLHRYSFNEAGAGLQDSIGSAHGTAVGEVTQADGRLIVAGDGYGDLPPEIVSDLTDMTIEVWFTSYQTRSWERVFDFGETDNGSGKSYLFFTSQVPSANGTMRLAVRPFGETELAVNTAVDTADDLETHIAVVFDDTNDEIRIYHDGLLSGSVATETSLSEINFQHCWLGRSMFTSDPLFEGDFNEVRIYGAALRAEHVARSFAAGPDTLVP